MCVCVLEYRNAEKADYESDVFKWDDGGGQAVPLEYRNAKMAGAYEYGARGTSPRQPHLTSYKPKLCRFSSLSVESPVQFREYFTFDALHLLLFRILKIFYGYECNLVKILAYRCFRRPRP